jgi:hypothetical protein
MAIIAMIAHSAFVCIILLMTVHTFMFRYSIKAFFRVTTSAIKKSMRTAQFKNRTIMVKYLFVKLNNIHVTTFMFGVTGMTFAFGDVMNFAVKISFVFYIAIDMLMTVATQLALLTSIKYLVAFTTFLFEPRMSTHQFARHNEVFHTLYGINSRMTLRER